MASGQTTNFGLNQWAAEDPVLREEFNRDNVKVDTAIMSCARVVVGTYNPQGTEEDMPFHVEVGFRPKAVLIWVNQVSGYASYLTHCAMVIDGVPVKVPNKDLSLLEIEDNGFCVLRHKYGDQSYYPQVAEWQEYLYFALK